MQLTDQTTSLAEIKAQLSIDADLTDLDASQIVEAFRSLDMLTVEIIETQAKLLLVLAARGYDLAQLNLGLRRHILLKIAHGQLLPEIYVKFAGSVRAVQKIANLPLPDQRRIVEHLGIETVVPGETETFVVRLLNPEYMTMDQLELVFAADHVRSPEAQIAILESRRTNEVVSRGKDDIRVFGNLQCDRTAGIVKMIKGKIAAAVDLIEAARWMDN